MFKYYGNNLLEAKVEDREDKRDKTGTQLQKRREVGEGGVKPGGGQALALDGEEGQELHSARGEKESLSQQ